MCHRNLKKHSTGALTKEQKKSQDELYKRKEEYDYLIIGSGNSALVFGSLMANLGKKVCILEAHDKPGGYAHTFEMKGYYFCAQVHYIWGCGEGGAMYEFLRRIGLNHDIQFNLLDHKGYDRMVMPDGKTVFIPYGFDLLIENICTNYPDQKKPMQEFIKILEKIQSEIRVFPNREIKFYEYLTQGWKFRNLIKYRYWTLQQVFDSCKLSKEAQAVLIANAGDMMSPPEELSIFAYVGLFCGYNTGAYYPKRHFKYYTERLADFIKEKGGHIFYETEVVKFNIRDNLVDSIETKDGKTFSGKTIICNMDPQAASHIIGRDKFQNLKPLTYKYSPSGVMIYLGLKGLNLKKLGFGSYNTWHLEQWDMNKMWKDQSEMNFSKPWVFMSTPSLHTKDRSTTPPGGEILEIATYAPFQPFKGKKNYAEYARLKLSIANLLLDFVEEKYIPNLRKHIEVKVIGTPTTNEDFCLAPLGNSYGSLLSPEQIGIGRLKAKTPFKNFYWCNASSGNAGIHGTTCTGMNLYMNLTGDRFFKKAKTMSEFIAKIREQK